MSRLTRCGASSLAAHRSGVIFSAITRTDGSAGCRAPRRGAEGGGGGGARRGEGGGRERVEPGEARRPVARAGGQRAAPDEGVGEHPLGAERLAPPPEQLL